MTRSHTTRQPSAREWSPTRVVRRLVLVAAAVASCAAGVQVASAQSSPLRAAFDDVHQAIHTGGDTGQTVVQRVNSETQPEDSGDARRSPPVRQPDSDATLPTLEGLLPATVPLAGSNGDAGLQLTKNDNGLITLIVRDKSLSQVLALIAQTQHLNIVASNDIDALISITLRDVPIEQALTAILSVANYTWVKRNNIILITSLTDAMNLPADVQGRQIQVFELDFAKSTDIEKVITTANLLSPIGRVSIAESSFNDNRRTREVVVVEDLPEPLARIAQYIAQVDQPPRQVLIEAHVLDIKLSDVNNCGVDLSALGINNSFELLNPATRLGTSGFASQSASGFVATLGSDDLGAVIEALQKTTDSKSLGSPKLLVLNEQEARIQIGETLYFKQITTTETSSQQGAGSVEAGTILRIKPRITRDNRVLLRVSPEVSSPLGVGSDGLPPNISKTTLETDVMLNDKQGMIIGGLIREKDLTEQSKVPYLGNVKGIGFLFRKSTVTKERHEIIVALLPRIQPYDCEYQNFEQGELVKSGVPLFHGPLWRTNRPWDPVLPDGKRVYYPLVPKKCCPPGPYQGLGSEYEIPPMPLPRQRMCEGPYGPFDPTVQPLGPFAPQEELPLPTPTPAASDDAVISDRP